MKNIIIGVLALFLIHKSIHNYYVYLENSYKKDKLVIIDLYKENITLQEKLSKYELLDRIKKDLARNGY
jgi:hypothetical protein